ncbi:sugar ABC transporter substrate-binding protein [Nakamurella aerolata]|nr:maltose ABC transporter substrate-binding protein [Nakamurella aerolata]
MKLRVTARAAKSAGIALTAGMLAVSLAACSSDNNSGASSESTAGGAGATTGDTGAAGASGGAAASQGGAAGSGAAASQPAGSAADTAAGGGAVAGSGATITVWADELRAKPLTDIAKKFEADTGAKVVIQQKDFGKITNDFIAQAPTGKGPDIIVTAHDGLGKMVQNGVVAPLELGDKASQFQDVTIKAMTYNGKVYGLPYAVENIALVRNTALAPDKPKDFDDAVATGQKLVKDGKAKFPFLVQQDAKGGDPYHMYPFQTSFGAPVFASTPDGGFDPKKLTMNSPEGVKFAQWLAKQGKAGVFKGTISQDIAKDAFAKGQSPYIVTGPWNAPDFEKAGIKFTIEDVPSAGGQPAKPFVGVQGFFVSAKSKNALLANSFVLDYLSTEQVQLDLYKSGGRAPALKSAFDKIKSDPVVAQFGAVGAKGTPQPNIPAMDAVWSDWGTTELAIIQGKGDPKALWDKMCASIESKIAAG